MRGDDCSPLTRQGSMAGFFLEILGGSLTRVSSYLGECLYRMIIRLCSDS